MPGPRAAERDMERGVFAVSIELLPADVEDAGSAWVEGLLSLLQERQTPAAWGLPQTNGTAPAWLERLRNAAPPQDLISLPELHTLWGAGAGWHVALPGPLARSIAALNDLLAVPPPTTCRSLATLEIPRLNGLQRLVPDGVRAQRIVWGLDRAVRRCELFHVRLSSASLGGDAERARRVLTPGLRMAARLHELGEVDLISPAALDRR